MRLSDVSCFVDINYFPSSTVDCVVLTIKASTALKSFILDFDRVFIRLTIVNYCIYLQLLAWPIELYLFEISTTSVLINDLGVPI